VRPSNEALLRARVPGAQDQRGGPSNLFHRARSASKEGTWPLPPNPSETARCASTAGNQPPSTSLLRKQETRTENGDILINREWPSAFLDTRRPGITFFCLSNSPLGTISLSE